MHILVPWIIIFPEKGREFVGGINKGHLPESKFPCVFIATASLVVKSKTEDMVRVPVYLPEKSGAYLPERALCMQSIAVFKIWTSQGWNNCLSGNTLAARRPARLLSRTFAWH